MRARQHGVAIVLAMGVVMLAALAASTILVAQGTWARQAELTGSHVQAQLLIQSGLDWARALLGDDRRAGAVDHHGEPWALRLPPLPVENGTLEGRIDDQQGRFNLNNLLQRGRINTTQLAHFRRLLAVLDLAPALADSLALWMDAGGMAPPPAPSTAARSLVDVGDLALVPGFDAPVRARLAPFVTALPRSTAINVNTASAEVIHAVMAALSLDDARAIVARREPVHFRDYAEFFRSLPEGLVVPNEDVAVGSDYFLATMTVTLGDAQATGTALLARTGAGWPDTIWRRFP